MSAHLAEVEEGYYALKFLPPVRQALRYFRKVVAHRKKRAAGKFPAYGGNERMPAPDVACAL